MKKLVDVAALVLAGVFAVAALFLLLRPGGLVRSEFDSMLEDRRRAHIVEEEWGRLVQDAPGVGADGEPPSAVEFVDYQCAYCRQFHGTLDSILRASDAEFRLAIRHNPNPANQTARRAALASICAQSQGAFESLHDYLMTSDDWYNSTDWLDVSLAAGVPEPASLVECMASEWADSVLSRDSAIAAMLALRATPAFAIQGRGLIVGSLSPEEVEDLVGR